VPSQVALTDILFLFSCWGRWDFNGDGTTDSTVAQPTYTYTQGGAFTAHLRVTNALFLTDQTTLSIAPGNTAPVPTIVQPTASLLWSAGDMVTVSGTAMDAQDGQLPGSQLAWRMILHHCTGSDITKDCHVHEVYDFTGSSGTISMPEHEFPSYVTLRLTATDFGSGAAPPLSAFVELDIHPRSVNLAVDTDPTGLSLAVAFDSVPCPKTLQFIGHSKVSLTAPQQQITQSGTVYEFLHWTDGSTDYERGFTIDADATYTAVYAVNSTLGPTNSLLKGDAQLAHSRPGAAILLLLLGALGLALARAVQ
jgi:PKD repeat protein